MHILATGLSGMVGTTLAKLLVGKFQFHDFSLETSADIRDRSQVFDAVKNFDGKYVLHLAAKTDVDACEADKVEDLNLLGLDLSQTDTINSHFLATSASGKWREKSSAFAINVIGTRNVAEACASLGKKLIYVSTDFVFSGKLREAYTEESKPDPINYYGLTKYWGERIVQNVLPDALIMRITFPFGAVPGEKLDFVAQIRKRLESKEVVYGITDNLVTPTYIEDIANALSLLIEKNEKGIYHIVGSTSLSSYETALAIAQNLNYDSHLVQEARMDDFYKDRAPRPHYLRTSNVKIQKAGYKPRTLPEALRLLQ